MCFMVQDDAHEKASEACIITAVSDEVKEAAGHSVDAQTGYQRG